MSSEYRLVALLKLDAEDRIYREHGVQAFIDYQREHEDEPIERGVAFPLVKALIELNGALGPKSKQAIAVVIISRNHPECSIRISKSLKHHGLGIREAVFTGNGDPLPHLKAYKVGLFLSSEEEAVRAALAAGISAGLIHGGPEVAKELDGTPIIAFDGDAVLFSDESDRVYQRREMAGFKEHENKHANIPLPPGPLHKFAIALEKLREKYPISEPPFRIALVTARDLEFCERPIRTLRKSGIRLDHATFCGGTSKTVALAALQPLIFFDDSIRNCNDASASAPTVRIPPHEEPLTHELPEKVSATLSSTRDDKSSRPERFLSVCKIFLRRNFADHEPTLRLWQQEHLTDLTDQAFEDFSAELERSVRGTPAGKQRRAAGAKNEDFTKFLLFIANLKRKHSA
ncbi:MAG: 5'-nucleotidase [Bryobacteraceae bacterium]|nr:5'-nucleotidase [Bryobacteraceae bacterium]